MSSPRLFRCILCLLAAHVANQARAQCTWLPSTGFSSTDDDVFASVALPNGELVIGGMFTMAGATQAGGIAKWNGSAWQPLGSGITLGGWVNALTPMPNGDVIAGGLFHTAGGAPAINVARWDGESWWPLGAGLDGPSTFPPPSVYSLATLPDGTLVAGGDFSFSGGSAVGSLARWNGSSWSPLADGLGLTNPCVYVIAPTFEGDLLVGGDYQYGSEWRKGFVARWNGTAWTVLASNLVGNTPAWPHVPGRGAVYALLPLQGGAFIAGGNFRVAPCCGSEFNFVMQWDGAAFHSLGAGMDRSVYSLVSLPGGDLAALGYFTQANGAPAKGAARWNGTTWTEMGAGPGSSLRSTASLNGELVAVGQFYDGAGSVGALDTVSRWNGLTWSVWGRGTNGWIDQLATAPNGDLLATGRFSTIEGVRANAVARWDGSAWHALGSGLNDFAWSIAGAPNGDVIAGGEFTIAGGVGVNNIARWNGSSWSPLGLGIAGGTGSNSASVFAVVVMSNGDIVAGGDFQQADGRPAANIARWNNSTWERLGDGTNSPVRALAMLPNGDLVAGGSFSSPAGGVARWDGHAWWPMGGGIELRYPANAVVGLVALPNGDLVVGGHFSLAGSTPVQNIARWDGSSWSSLGSIPVPSAIIAQPDGDIIVAVPDSGGFGGSDLKRWTGATWTDLGTVSYGPIYSLANTQEGGIAAGGAFHMAGGLVSPYLARWSCACYANCDNSTAPPMLNINDFQCFLNKFAAQDPYANCDNSTAPPTLNTNDFQCFLNKFAAGCP